MVLRVVKVLYFGLVQSAVGTPQEEITLAEGTRLGDLLDLLVQRHGEPLRAILLTRDGRLKSLARLMVDGKPASEMGGLEAQLGGSTEVCVLVRVDPMLGGSKDLFG